MAEWSQTRQAAGRGGTALLAQARPLRKRRRPLARFSSLAPEPIRRRQVCAVASRAAGTFGFDGGRSSRRATPAALTETELSSRGGGRYRKELSLRSLERLRTADAGWSSTHLRRRSPGRRRRSPSELSPKRRPRSRDRCRAPCAASGGRCSCRASRPPVGTRYRAFSPPSPSSHD